ncbi:MAG TPA: hypothetical protein VEF04_05875 [Blastocatellia bacterium]|nr:hypothetical protein [Blastocatellia bacterium]
MGHKVVDPPRAVTTALDLPGYMGDAHVIMIEDETGVRLGAADPRRGGKAVGY